MKIVRIVAAMTLAALAASACSTSEPAHPQMGAPEESSITYSETIAPILQQRCESCHHTGGIAPFSLETYADVVANAPLVRQKVLAREMPPWGAFDQPDCKMQHKLKDDLRLTDDEIAKIATWVENGTPVGDATKAPPARIFGATGLLDKTNTFKTKPYVVSGAGKDEFRCFTIDPGFTQDTWISGANVVPGDPTVVHHALVFVDAKGDSVANAAKDPAGGGDSYDCFGGPGVSGVPSLLLAWAPGVPPANYGQDSGIKVPKGARLVLQVHYHPHTDASVADQTAFELTTLPSKPSFVTQILLVGNADTSDPKQLIHLVAPSADHFLIPAGAAQHTEAMEVNIPEKIGGFTFPATHVLAAGAHMHWAGTNMKIEVTRAIPGDGQPEHECILSTPKYDFNWQRAYGIDEEFENLPLLSPGDSIRFTCDYNNSLGNKYVAKSLAEDHSSLHDIKLGETTRDEMCLGVIVGIRRATAADY